MELELILSLGFVAGKRHGEIFFLGIIRDIPEEEAAADDVGTARFEELTVLKNWVFGGPSMLGQTIKNKTKKETLRGENGMKGSHEVFIVYLCREISLSEFRAQRLGCKSRYPIKNRSK